MNIVKHNKKFLNLKTKNLRLENSFFVSNKIVKIDKNMVT